MTRLKHDGRIHTPKKDLRDRCEPQRPLREPLLLRPPPPLRPPVNERRLCPNLLPDIEHHTAAHRVLVQILLKPERGLVLSLAPGRQIRMLKFADSLFGRVVIALILGVVLGIWAPAFAVSLKPIGDGFIKIIQMIVAPLVFCVIVHGIAGGGDLKKVGRVGVKTILYFEVITTLALLIGMVLAFVLHPGQGMNIESKSLDAASMASYVDRAKSMDGVGDFFLRLIPSTFGDAFAKGDILQVLAIAVLFGAALSLMGEKGKPVSVGIDFLSQVFFKIMGLIIHLAPLGVLGAIAYTTGKYGVHSLEKLGLLVAMFYLSCALFVIIVLGVIMRIIGFSLWKLIRYFREEFLIVAGTASSDAVLPQIMKKLERLGIKDSTVGLVIPTGYSFNLDGFSIYLTLAVVFIAQATNTALSLHDLGLVLLISLVASKGAHGIPGSAIVILAATLSAIPAVPVIGLALLVPIDWFIGIGRALTNLLGNCVATMVIASWENDIDRSAANAELNRTTASEENILSEAGALRANSR
jgi:aerobic C4-dicarboxylate transport protein